MCRFGKERSGDHVPVAFSPVAALALAALLGGCGGVPNRGAPETTLVRPAPSAHVATTAGDASTECIKSATDPRVARSVVYAQCVAASNALLRVKSPASTADDYAVTASILEIYAAYALLSQSPKNTKHYSAMLREADERLKALARAAATAQTRERAAAARSCLIERDAGCLQEWAHYQ